MNLINSNQPVTIQDASDPGYRQLVPNPTSGSLGTLYATNLNGKIYGYNLKRIIIHSPSEHKIEGDSYDLEVQFGFDIKSEFSGATRNKANVAILYTTSTSGDSSDFIEILKETGDFNQN